MKFSIYGRFDIEVLREQNRWATYRLGQGTRRPENDLHIPADLAERGILVYLDDVFHEYAAPNTSIIQY